MVRNFLIGCAFLALVVSSSGCLTMLATAGGTALWQSGKVISEENVSMEKSAAAVEATFREKKISLTDKVKKEDVTQLRGEDQGKTRIAVDVFSKGPNNCKLEIRYGMNEENPARELLNDIKKRL